MDDRGRAYLAARGLDRTIDTLLFGVVLSPRPEHQQMRGRLAIPFIGPRGNIYDMRFRCIEEHDCKEEHCPKYLGVPGVETRIYNARALTAPTDYLMVTEGELDAATLTACGWPASGIPGANAWKPHYSRMLSGFSKVILFADGDEAGEKLAHAFRKSLVSSGTVIMCEKGQDVNSIYLRDGKAGLQSLLKEDEDE